MGYATVTDIQGDLNGVDFSATNSSISVAEVQAMIDQESAVIDQYISVKYATPVNDASALLVLKKICIDLVVHRVNKVLEIDGASDAPDSNMYQSSKGAAFKNSINMLKMFASGQMTLTGADINEAKTEKVYVSPSEGSSERVFKKDEVQW